MWRQRTKKIISSHIHPLVSNMDQCHDERGAKRERKKVKQTLDKQGRPVCPRLALIGQNKAVFHPKLLSIRNMVHRSARITFLILEGLLAESDSSGRACVCDVDVTIPADSQNRKPQHEKTEKRKGRGRETGTNVWHEK